MIYGDKKIQLISHLIWQLDSNDPTQQNRITVYIHGLEEQALSLAVWERGSDVKNTTATEHTGIQTNEW